MATPLLATTVAPFKAGEQDSPVAYGQSPDSEEIEQARTEGSIAKLSERGANPRQPGEKFKKEALIEPLLLYLY